MSDLARVIGASSDKSLEGKTVDELVPKMTRKEIKSRHDEPCPPAMGEIGTDPEVNEWILNHLPLTEEQKITLRDQLVMDQLKQDSSEKRCKAKLTRVYRKHEADKDSKRTGVKKMTMHS